MEGMLYSRDSVDFRSCGLQPFNHRVKLPCGQGCRSRFQSIHERTELEGGIVNSPAGQGE